MDLVAESDLYPALWNTQYVTFNALSITYVWIMQRKHGRLLSVQFSHDETTLFKLAETVQAHLANVTQYNAPSLRYGILLEELQREVRSALLLPDNPQSSDAPTYGAPVDNGAGRLIESILPESDYGSDFPAQLDLWLQLDTFSFYNEPSS
ncbi:hypothetical protein AAFC00_005033 [Neodothiora populina]|uniref:Uncharacterized protein n=1 Tax=Neodothiora populina TaxID=2781224 RepID=A0ABR3P4A5_9PEZI